MVAPGRRRDAGSVRNPYRREPMSGIWQPLAHVRRRLTGGARRASLPDGFAGGPATDLTFALNRADLERLIDALTQVPGVEPGRPDTPARLEAALRVAIADASGSGALAVTRRPAGVYTPETWQIEVLGANPRTQRMVERALQGGGPA
jgi:hypothetical protein